MTNKQKEKVLHGLSSCGTDYGIPNICEITECPYREDKAWCVHELAHDAEMLIAELLKAQEPVEVKIEQDTYPDETPKEFALYYCGNCGDDIADEQKFCANCGRPVKWE